MYAHVLRVQPKLIVAAHEWGQSCTTASDKFRDCPVCLAYVAALSVCGEA